MLKSVEYHANTYQAWSIIIRTQTLAKLTKTHHCKDFNQIFFCFVLSTTRMEDQKARETRGIQIMVLCKRPRTKIGMQEMLQVGCDRKRRKKRGSKLWRMRAYFVIYDEARKRHVYFDKFPNVNRKGIEKELDCFFDDIKRWFDMVSFESEGSTEEMYA